MLDLMADGPPVRHKQNNVLRSVRGNGREKNPTEESTHRHCIAQRQNWMCTEGTYDQIGSSDVQRSVHEACFHRTKCIIVLAPVSIDLRYSMRL